MQSAYTGGKQIKSSRDSPNLVVNFRRTIQRYDHVVQAVDDLVRIPLNQEPGAQESGANPPCFQKTTQAKEIRVHQWLSAREDHPFHAQARYISSMPLQFSDADLPR